MTTLRALIGLACVLATPVAWALGPAEIFEKVAPSVWSVRGLDAQERPFSHGSGVVVDKGAVITRCHVLAKAKAIQVRRGGRAFDAALEHADVERDLCLLRVEEFNAPAVSLAPRPDSKVGQRVYAITVAEKLGPALSEGVITGLQSEDAALPPMQTTVALSHGASGGGLFDDQGRLIGIVTLNVPRAGIAPSIQFASPVAWLAEIPARAKQHLASHAAQAAATQPSAAASAESWTYRLSGRRVRTTSQEITLASADADEIVEQLFAADGRPQRVTHTKGAYLVPVGEFSLFSPYLATFNNLSPGMRLEIDNRDHRTCSAGWSCSVTGQVVGTERVKVPAGEFDAVRVRIEQTWVGLSQTSDRGETGGRILNVWYVPELKRAVKFSSRGEESRYIETTFDFELTSYRVKGK